MYFALNLSLNSEPVFVVYLLFKTNFQYCNIYEYEIPEEICKTDVTLTTV